MSTVKKMVDASESPDALPRLASFPVTSDSSAMALIKRHPLYPESNILEFRLSQRDYEPFIPQSSKEGGENLW